MPDSTSFLHEGSFATDNSIPIIKNEGNSSKNLSISKDLNETIDEIYRTLKNAKLSSRSYQESLNKQYQPPYLETHEKGKFTSNFNDSFNLSFNNSNVNNLSQVTEKFSNQNNSRTSSPQKVITSNSGVEILKKLSELDMIENVNAPNNQRITKSPNGRRNTNSSPNFQTLNTFPVRNSFSNQRSTIKIPHIQIASPSNSGVNSPTQQNQNVLKINPTFHASPLNTKKEDLNSFQRSFRSSSPNNLDSKKSQGSPVSSRKLLLSEISNSLTLGKTLNEIISLYEDKKNSTLTDSVSGNQSFKNSLNQSEKIHINTKSSQQHTSSTQLPTKSKIHHDIDSISYNESIDHVNATHDDEISVTFPESLLSDEASVVSQLESISSYVKAPTILKAPSPSNTQQDSKKRQRPSVVLKSKSSSTQTSRPKSAQRNGPQKKKSTLKKQQSEFVEEAIEKILIYLENCHRNYDPNEIRMIRHKQEKLMEEIEEIEEDWKNYCNNNDLESIISSTTPRSEHETDTINSTSSDDTIQRNTIDKINITNDSDLKQKSNVFIDIPTINKKLNDNYNDSYDSNNSISRQNLDQDKSLNDENIDNTDNDDTSYSPSLHSLSELDAFPRSIQPTADKLEYFSNNSNNSNNSSKNNTNNSNNSNFLKNKIHNLDTVEEIALQHLPLIRGDSNIKLEESLNDDINQNLRKEANINDISIDVSEVEYINDSQNETKEQFLDDINPQSTEDQGQILRSFEQQLKDEMIELIESRFSQLQVRIIDEGIDPYSPHSLPSPSKSTSPH